MHDFLGSKSAFYRFRLSQNEINLHKNPFAISLAQQGPRLSTYRPKDTPKSFEPSSFSMLLLSEEGELVKDMSSYYDDGDFSPHILIALD